jgi:hypothetical protein
MLYRYVYSIPSALGRRKDVPSGTSDDGGTAVVARGLSHSSPASMTSRIAPFDQGMESGETAAEEASSPSSASSSSKRGDARDPERIQHRPTSQLSQPNAEIVSPSSIQQLLVLPHQAPPHDLTAAAQAPEPTVANSPGVMQHFDERRAYYSSRIPLQQASSLSSSSYHRLGASSDYQTERFSARLSDDAAVSHGISPSENQSDNWMHYIAPIPNMTSMMGSSRDAFTQPDHRLVRLSRSTTSQQYPHLGQNTTRPGLSSYFLPPTGTRPHSLLPGTATAKSLHVAHPATAKSLHVAHPSQHRTYSVDLINPLHQRRPAANSALKSWTQYEYS